MCLICKKVVSVPPAEALLLIESEIRKGRDPEHFREVLDVVLGTQEPETDSVRDEAWEYYHRKGSSS